MSETVAHQIIREHYVTLRHEAARVQPAKLAHENHETRPYVVRDLSWELARFLDAETFATSGSSNSNPPQLT